MTEKKAERWLKSSDFLYKNIFQSQSNVFFCDVDYWTYRI